VHDSFGKQLHKSLPVYDCRVRRICRHWREASYHQSSAAGFKPHTHQGLVRYRGTVRKFAFGLDGNMYGLQCLGDKRVNCNAHSECVVYPGTG
jgi:hypothetical protein